MPRTSKTQNSTVTLAEGSGADRLDAFRRDLLESLARTDAPITVDLSQADMLDSALLAAVLVAAQTAAGSGRTVTLVASPRVFHGLAEWRFDTVLSISEAPPAP